MNFLPDDYEIPKSTNSQYFKPQDGENKIRILSKPLMGWEDWTLEKKPIRFRMNEKPLKSIDPKKPIKHFWAMVVWNVQLEQIQIYQPTQSTIQEAIKSLGRDEDWGSPYDYDIKIFKKGEQKLTEYNINPSPKKPVSKEILQAFRDKPIQLEALFEGLDPFAPGYKYYTTLMSDPDEPKIVDLMGEKVDVKPLYIGDTEFVELSELLQKCAESVRSGFKEYLLKAFSIDTMAHLEMKEYQKIKDMLTVRALEHQKILVEAEIADTPEARKEGKKK